MMPVPMRGKPGATVSSFLGGCQPCGPPNFCPQSLSGSSCPDQERKVAWRCPRTGKGAASIEKGLTRLAGQAYGPGAIICIAPTLE